MRDLGAGHLLEEGEVDRRALALGQLLHAGAQPRRAQHRLGLVAAPTVVLHSRHDLRIPLEQGRAVAEGIPGARFVALESRNHVLVGYEPAWRTCIAEIHRFLSENGI